MQEIVKARNNQLDILKGIAAIAVVLGHIIQSVYSSNFDSNIVFRIIYSFHMPLFFWISGYIVEMKKDYSVNSIIKKIYRLVIPFLTWIVINNFLQKGDIKILINHFIKCFYDPSDGGLWFLWILFLCNMLAYIINNLERIIGYYEISIIIVFLILGIGWLLSGFTLILGYRLLCKESIFFVFGIYCSRKKVFENIRNTRFLSILICTLYCILVLFWHRDKYCIFYNYLDTVILKIGFWKYLIYFGEIIFYFTVTLMGLYFWYRISFYIERNDIVKNVLTIIGMYSLEIYIFHPYVRNVQSLSLFSIIINLMIGVIVPIIIGCIIRKVPVISLLLVGFKKK